MWAVLCLIDDRLIHIRILAKGGSNVEYDTLNAMPAESFLNPALFVTSYDAANQARDGYGDKQFADGLRISREAVYVYVSANGTWGAETKPRFGGSINGQLSAYEGIGYHANTADLLRGFLAGPAPLVIYRRDSRDGKIAGGKFEIKPRTGD